MLLNYIIALHASFSLAYGVRAAVLDGGPPGAAKSKAGAVESILRDAGHQHWAFQPIARIEPPVVQNISWVQTPIDRFILAVLEAQNIPPAPPATKEELIRRVTLDLIGLPPTISELDAFVNDSSPDASAKLVERLLASPHYGERWGRHWLDVARFAETDGFEHDTVRTHAWRYRDYVIHSFNRDKPYDRFIKEQLAGDELHSEEPEALAATAFNLLGPDMVDSSDQVQRRHIRLNDMTDTAALAFLGLTLGCARCHDHKFEALSQKDYYSLQAFFTPAIFRDDLPIPNPQERSAHHTALERYNNLTKSQREEIAAIEAPYRKKLYDQKLAKLSPEAQLAHKTPPAERTTEQINQIQETSALLEIIEKEILTIMSMEDQSRLKVLKETLATFPKPPPLPMTIALLNSKTNSAQTFVRIRGDYSRPGEEVQPGFPAVLEAVSNPLHPLTRPGGHPLPIRWGKERGEARANGTKDTPRTALAAWIASPNNPLTARVMINRIWQHHFGRGIVPTPSDFGLQGRRPSHPQLLDWLASEFIARGWSIKQMHKLILLSATYQQSSKAGHGVPTALNPEATVRSTRRAEDSAPYRVDPDNRLYSRWQRTRLEGEVIRDSLLAISGGLNRQMAGPGIFPPIPEDVFKGAKGWNVSKNPADQNRRSIYIFARRNLRFPFLEVFDAPDSNLSCPERPRSISSPQALTLLNSEEVMAASQATATRLLNEAVSDEDRITLAYRLILGRRLTEKERALAHEFLIQAPWSELCRALFNLNAFVYVN